MKEKINYANCFEIESKEYHKMKDRILELGFKEKLWTIEKYGAEQRIKELKSEKSELIECLKRCNRDIPRINDILASCGFHPFTLMEKDIKETLQNHEVNK